MITPDLFKRFPGAREMAEAETDEILEYIKTCSYPNSKARYLMTGPAEFAIIGSLPPGFVVGNPNE